MRSWVLPAPALLVYSPSWWVVKLLSQLFPVKSPHQEARHLASLKKNYFSAGNCCLKTARPPGRSCQGADVCAGRAAEDAELQSRAGDGDVSGSEGRCSGGTNRSCTPCPGPFLSCLFSKEEGLFIWHTKGEMIINGVCRYVLNYTMFSLCLIHA